MLFATTSKGVVLASPSQGMDYLVAISADEKEPDIIKNHKPEGEYPI